MLQPQTEAGMSWRLARKIIHFPSLFAHHELTQISGSSRRALKDPKHPVERHCRPFLGNHRIISYTTLKTKRSRWTNLGIHYALCKSYVIWEETTRSCTINFVLILAGFNLTCRVFLPNQHHESWGSSGHALTDSDTFFCNMKPTLARHQRRRDWPEHGDCTLGAAWGLVTADQPISLWPLDLPVKSSPQTFRPVLGILRRECLYNVNLLRTFGPFVDWYWSGISCRRKGNELPEKKCLPPGRSSILHWSAWWRFCGADGLARWEDDYQDWRLKVFVSFVAWWEASHVCWGLNSHYIHVKGDGHQPNSRGLYTHYEDSPLKVGWPSPI